jgi:hypothetical protein
MGSAINGNSSQSIQEYSDMTAIPSSGKKKSPCHDKATSNVINGNYSQSI